MKPVLLDTHVWIWLSIGQMESLSPRAQRSITGCTRWISAISCWELAKLVERRRIGFTIPTLSWIRRSLTENDLRIADLTPEIAVESTVGKGTTFTVSLPVVRRIKEEEAEPASDTAYSVAVAQAR